MPLTDLLTADSRILPYSERFDTNVQRIIQRDPNLAQALVQQPLVNMQLGLNATGDVIGTVWDHATQQWAALANPDNPWGEAEADATALYTPDAKVFIIFGLGLGYFPVAFARKLKPYQRLAIFETRSSLYAAAMRAVDLGDLMGAPGKRVDTYLGDQLDGVLQHWFLSFDSHEKFHCCPPFRSGFTMHCDSAMYDALLARSLEMFQFHQVGLATWAQFGSCIGDNDLENLPEYVVTPGMNQFAGAWAGKPAVCIAAGPSLVKNLHWLLDPGLRSKVAILTVGTCYALLKSLGIEPDLVTTIDFQELNWGDQFKDVPLDRDTPLLYLHSTYPTTARVWPGPRYVAMNASDTTQWLTQFCEAKPNAAMVQTVAHLNLVAAYHLGASPILLIGQDLSMPIDQHHAVGARVQDRPPQDDPAEVRVQMPDYRGQPVYTRHSFLSMRTVFGHLVAGQPGVPVVNCTEGGLALDGVPNRPFSDVLHELPAADGSPPLRALLAERCASYTPQVQWEPLRTGLQNIRDQVEGIGAAALDILDTHGLLQALGDDAPAELRSSYEQRILAYDNLPARLPQAFNQVAVRRFDLVQLLSAIPLPDGTSEADMRAHMVQRLRSVAQCTQDELPKIRGLIERCIARTDDLYVQYGPLRGQGVPSLTGMLERESYHALAQYFAHTPPQRDEDMIALGRLYAAQQLYREAAALLCWFPTEQPAARVCLAQLARFTAQQYPATLAYWRTLGGAPLAQAVLLAAAPVFPEPTLSAVATSGVLVPRAALEVLVSPNGNGEEAVLVVTHAQEGD